MGKCYSAYCFALSAIGPLYGLSELAGCMNPKSVVEVTLLPHVAMVVSKQQYDVTETLTISINNIYRKESAAHSKTSEASHPPQRHCRKTSTTL